MGDTHIKISGNPPTPTRENESFPSITSRKAMERRKGVMFASVTLMVGATVLLSVATIGFLSFLCTTSRAGSQSKPGHIVTSEVDDQSGPLHIEKREQGACPEDLCLTKECIHAASNLLNYMDDSVDPCDDFYRYACGGWLKENEYQVAGNNFVYGVIFNVLSDSIDIMLKELLRTGGNVPKDVLQAKPYQDLFLFYERCREVEPGTLDMSPVHEVLRGLDQFQVGKPFETSSWDLTRALLELFQINGAPLFDIILDPDVQKKDKYALSIISPRRFGLIAQLTRRPLHRRNHRGLQEFLRARGRRMLFGEMAGDATVKGATLGGRPAARAGTGKTLARHAFQRDVPRSLDPVENIVPTAGDLKEREREAEVTPPQETDSASSFYLNPVPSPHTPPPTPATALPSITTTSTTLPTTTIPHSITTHTGITSQPSATHQTHTGYPLVTTTRGPHLTYPHTDFPPSSTTATTTTSTLQEEDKEENATQDENGSTQQSAVSRRTIYRIFKGGMEAKRLEMLGSTLQDTFPNASVASSSSWSSSSSTSSSSTSSSPEGDVPDDVYSEVMTRFLPILQELLPTEREVLEVQETGTEYNHFTISVLQQRCPVIDWSLLLGGLLNKTITEEQSIYVQFPEHLTKLCTLLDNTEPWVVHYALLTLYSYDVLQETVYAAEGMDRDDFCLQAVKGVFGEVMSNLYLHHVGNETLKDIKATTSSIMEVLLEEAEDALSTAAWLGEEDRRRALQKLQTLDVKVGAREEHWDIAFINKSHEEISLPPNASFLHIVMELYRGFRQQLYQLHRAPIESDDFIWSFTVQPYVIDAFYSVNMNSIVFPEAFFHPPFHRHRAPHYLNFGSTAAPMAHEMFHALDLRGVQYDENGLRGQPFSEEVVARLNATADCYHALLNDAFYEEQYISDTLIAFEIDNIITKNENLADISGLSTAFKAYLRWEEREGVEPRLPALPLTPHQVFFVSTAQVYCTAISQVGKILLMELDEHLPNKIRVNGMMKNSPEFAKTFNCSATSKMFSANTCHVL